MQVRRTYCTSSRIPTDNAVQNLLLELYLVVEHSDRFAVQNRFLKLYMPVSMYLMDTYTTGRKCFRQKRPP